MTYRDDGEAALARADALQRELDEASREQERLRQRADRAEAERDQLRVRLEGDQGKALVVTKPKALTVLETKALVVDVGEGLRRVRESDRVLMFLFLTVAVASAPLYPVAIPLAAVLSVVGLGGALVMRSGLRADRTLAIVDAVREFPDRVTRLQLVQTGRARAHVVIETSEGVGACRTSDPVELLARLARRCPNAKVEG